MRASLVLNIIEAYYKEKEDFLNAVTLLAQEEEKKGNEDLSTKIMNIIDKKYRNTNSKKTNYTNEKYNNSFFSLSNTISSQNLLPKDKESAMNLMEIIEPNISFNNLILSENMKKEMEQIVNEWHKAEVLLKAGVLPTRRVLFYGPPGCGKTVMGLALAKALGKKVAYVRLDSLFSSYLGQTSTNLRKIFEAVSDGSLALFLDEFDSIGKKRDDTQEVGELKRIVITLLQNLDLLPPNVLIIAATNHQHLLDPAVWRRFDVAISVDEPTPELRKNLIEETLKDYKKNLDIDLELLIKFTEGMNISRIKDLINQVIKSYLLSNKKNKINMNYFIQSIFTIEKFDTSKDAMFSWAYELNKRGLSLRELEDITKIPKTTLNNHFKKMGGVANGKK